MDQIIIVIHILLGLSIIGLIMMQQGKGADAGAGFGAGASGSVFGAQGSASFLSRMTAVFAALFFITSLGLAWLNGHKGVASVDLLGGEQSSAETVVPNLDEGKAALPAISVPQSETKAEVAPLATPPVAVPESAPVQAVTPPDVAPKPDAVEPTPAPTQDKPAETKVEQAPAQEEKPVKHHEKKAAKGHHKK